MTSSPDKPLVERARELLAKATPGEWYPGDSHDAEIEGHQAIHSDSWGAFIQVVVERNGDPVEDGQANLDLVLLAPDLAREVIRQADLILALTGENERLKAVIDRELYT